MNNTSISYSIRQFILSHFPSARRRSLRDEDLLIENGIIDSMGVLDVVSFIESEYGLTVLDEELIPENFQNIVRLAAYVENKRNGSAVTRSITSNI